MYAVDEIRVLAERAVDAVPARLGDDVGHRPEQALDADRAQFPGGDLAERAHLFRVARRRRGRAGRATARSPAWRRGGGAAPGRRAHGVARVGAEHDRDAEAAGLGHLLQAVVELRRDVGRLARVGADEDVADVALGDRAASGLALPIGSTLFGLGPPWNARLAGWPAGAPPRAPSRRGRRAGRAPRRSGR